MSISTRRGAPVTVSVLSQYSAPRQRPPTRLRKTKRYSHFPSNIEAVADGGVDAADQPGEQPVRGSNDGVSDTQKNSALRRRCRAKSKADPGSTRPDQ